jgi:VIT1/CCC1 family predicted Fe2+/Mn2+ transporter
MTLAAMADLAITVPVSHAVNPDEPEPVTRPRGPSDGGRPWAVRALIERATLREVLMGAQDNLTNVLAVALGVTVGAGRADLVALAGLAAACAEAVSMGGVLYTSTRAELGLDALERSGATTGKAAGPTGRLTPAQSGFITFAAALVGGLVPLVPFVLLPLSTAVATSIVASVAALFALGSWTGRIAGHIWWHDGLRLLAVAVTAALVAAVVGTVLRIDQ